MWRLRLLLRLEEEIQSYSKGWRPTGVYYRCTLGLIQVPGKVYERRHMIDQLIRFIDPA